MTSLQKTIGKDFYDFFPSGVENEFVMGDVPLPPETRTDEEIARDEVQAELNWKHSQV